MVACTTHRPAIDRRRHRHSSMMFALADRQVVAESKIRVRKLIKTDKFACHEQRLWRKSKRLFIPNLDTRKSAQKTTEHN